MLCYHTLMNVMNFVLRPSLVEIKCCSGFVIKFSIGRIKFVSRHKLNESLECTHDEVSIQRSTTA